MTKSLIKEAVVIGVDDEDVYETLVQTFGVEPDAALDLLREKLTDQEMQEIAWDLAEWVWNGDLFHEALETILKQRGFVKEGV